MPPLKQPGPLRDLAMDALITFLSNYCHELKAADSLDKLRESIAVMKTDICPHIPWKLSADFHERFLLKFRRSQDWPIKFPHSHISAVFEIIMDKKIDQLKLTENIVAFLDPDQVHRIHGLKELDMSTSMRTPVRNCIEKFNLQDITTIDFKFTCTDTALEVVGRNCPKLEHLDVSHSQQVTDKGLQSLSLCTELRVFGFAGCKAISRHCINEFMSLHDKIEKLSAWGNSNARGFEDFIKWSSQTYPLINSLRTSFDVVTNDHFRIIAVKFPNLTSLSLMGKIAGDLKILKSLGKLSELDLSSTAGSTHSNLRELFTFIGSNITDLRLGCRSSQACVTQKHLDSIWLDCGSLERLEIQYWPRFRGKKLVVPPFQKLKRFQCLISRQFSNCFVELKFGQMPKLEQLTIFRTYMSHESLSSIVLGDLKFPSLKLIRMYEVSGRHDLKLIKQIARDRNLDFHISDMLMFE